MQQLDESSQERMSHCTKNEQYHGAFSFLLANVSSKIFVLVFIIDLFYLLLAGPEINTHQADCQLNIGRPFTTLVGKCL